MGDQLDRIERLAQLREKGMLTEEEFQQQKAQILTSAPLQAPVSPPVPDPTRTMSGHKKVSGAKLAIVGGGIAGLCLILALVGWIRESKIFSGTSVTITRAEFGSGWPFTVDEGTLRCERVGTAQVESITFTTGTTTYSVNAIARESTESRSKGYGFIESITLDDPANPGKKMSIYPIIDRGLALCD
jgi:hypothetical protein